MTPVSQHTYSVASVSYLGPAYTDCQADPKAPAPPPAPASKRRRPGQLCGCQTLTTQRRGRPSGAAPSNAAHAATVARVTCHDGARP